MKLTQTALNRIKGNTRLMSLLCIELNKTMATIYRYISKNDSRLTQAAALKVIKEETGLKEKEILEAVTA